MGLTAASPAKPVAALPPPKGMADTPDLLADAIDPGSWYLQEPTHGSIRAQDPVNWSRRLFRAGVSTESILAIDLQTRLPTLDRLGVESLLGTDFLAVGAAN